MSKFVIVIKKLKIYAVFAENYKAGYYEILYPSLVYIQV